ncbi:MAG: RNA-binding protein [Acidobacteriota bacterium]
MGNKLYIGNLPFQVGEEELRQLMEQAGAVQSVRVVRDAATGRARGFAFVEMGSDEEAQKAITQLNGQSLQGRSLTVNEARSSGDRPRDGGRGPREFGGGSGGRQRW